MLARLFAFVVLFGVSASVDAAEIKFVDDDNFRRVTIVGPINALDGQKFKQVSDSFAGGATVVLESEGGSAGAAIAIGEEIRRRKFATAVFADKTCASACGFIWLAGKPRIMDKRAHIGFHAVYLIEEGKPVPSAAANAVMGSYLGSIGIPVTAIYFVTMAGPEGMSWMTADVAVKLGIEVYEPVIPQKPETTKKAKLEDLFRRADEDEAIDISRVPIPERAPRLTQQNDLVFIPSSKRRLLKYAQGYFLAGQSINFTAEKLPRISECRTRCFSTPGCVAFCFNSSEWDCYLKRGVSYAVPNPAFASEYNSSLTIDFVK